MALPHGSFQADSCSLTLHVSISQTARGLTTLPHRSTRQTAAVLPHGSASQTAADLTSGTTNQTGADLTMRLLSLLVRQLKVLPLGSFSKTNAGLPYRCAKRQ
jgi:hypothetical protein